MTKLLCTLLMTLVSSYSIAATYYVAKTGSDTTGTGTSLNPYKTIIKGYSKLNPGDTLIVGAGIYSEYTPNYGLLFNRSGTAENPITIKSQLRGAAVIDLQFNKDAHSDIYLTGNYNIIEGFKMRNAFWGGISVYGDSNKIIRNEISGIGSQSGGITQSNCFCGVRSAPGVVGTVYDGNYIHHNGRPKSHLDHGMYLYGDNETIINNIITNNSSYGLQVAGKATVSNLKVYNNVFAFNKWSGLMLWNTLNGIDIKNNIFYKNNYYGIDSYNAHGSGVNITRNIFYGNLQGIARHNNAGSDYTFAMKEVMTKNPLFINETNGNYRLQSSSSAINTGLNLSTYVKTDHSGLLRPQGGAYDIGAYEYKGLSSIVVEDPPPTRIPGP